MYLFAVVPNIGTVYPYQDTYFWEKAFPTLFPYGDGGPNCPREVKITDQEYDIHCLLHHSRRFSKNFNWMAARYKYRCSQISSSVSYIASRGESASDIPTVAEIQQVASHSSSGIDRNKFQQEMERLLKKLSYYGSRMKTTMFSIRDERRKLLSMISSAEMPEPIWFLTLSSADLYWPQLFMAIDPNLTEENVSKLSLLQRSIMLQENPVLACILFRGRLLSILEHILKGESHPLGYLVDYWLRIEFQNRGSLHVHCILWCLFFYILGHKMWWNGDELSDMMLGKIPVDLEVFNDIIEKLDAANAEFQKEFDAQISKVDNDIFDTKESQALDKDISDTYCFSSESVPVVAEHLISERVAIETLPSKSNPVLVPTKHSIPELEMIEMLNGSSSINESGNKDDNLFFKY